MNKYMNQSSNFIIVIFVLGLLFFLGGCVIVPFPRRIVANSTITGVLMDINTGERIRNAKVTLFTSLGTISTYSDNGGMFIIKPSKKIKWSYGLFIGVFDSKNPCSKSLVIEHNSYRTMSIGVHSCGTLFDNIESYDDNKMVIDSVGSIRLVPKSNLNRMPFSQGKYSW